MYNALLFLRDCLYDLFDYLDRIIFDISGMSVSMLDIWIGFLVIGIIISAFWKGARDS